MRKINFVTAQDSQECLNYSSKIIKTSVGEIEYADRGDGPVLLSAHGSPGGYDQGLAMAEIFRKMVIELFHLLVLDIYEQMLN